jgi:hypothetical protein
METSSNINIKMRKQFLSLDHSIDGIVPNELWYNILSFLLF